MPTFRYIYSDTESCLLVVMLTETWEGDCYTNMGFLLGGLSSHEGVGQAILSATFPVAGLVVAFKLTGAPAVVQGAAAASLLPKLHVIIDHLIWVCMKNRNIQPKILKDTAYRTIDPFPSNSVA